MVGPSQPDTLLDAAPWREHRRALVDLLQSEQVAGVRHIIECEIASADKTIELIGTDTGGCAAGGLNLTSPHRFR